MSDMRETMVGVLTGSIELHAGENETSVVVVPMGDIALRFTMVTAGAEAFAAMAQRGCCVTVIGHATESTDERVGTDVRRVVDVDVFAVSQTVGN